MKNIGDILRKTREEKGYSLVDMQRETKLQQKYLSALENNQLDSLPGDMYYDSFVKQYAQALGLDGNKLLANKESQILDETPSVFLSDDGIYAPNGYFEDESSQLDEPVDYEAQRQAASEKLMESLKEEAAVEEKTEELDNYGQGDRSDETPQAEGVVGDDLDQENQEKREALNPIVTYKADTEEGKQDEEEQDYGNYEEDESQNRSFFERFGCSIITLLFLVIAALLLFFYFNSNSSTSNEPLEPESEQAQESSLGEEASDPESEPAEEASSQVSIEQIEADGSNGVYRMNANEAEEFMVNISASEDSAWVSIASDGQQLRQGVVEEGDMMEVLIERNASTITIQVGNAEATSIEINGSSLDFPPENTGNPTQILTINVE